jgi:hypothetical protein
MNQKSSPNDRERKRELTQDTEDSEPLLSVSINTTTNLDFDQQQIITEEEMSKDPDPFYSVRE